MINISCDSTDEMIMRGPKTDRVSFQRVNSTPCEPAIESTNLLINGDFSDWNEYLQPTAWTISDYYDYTEMVSPASSSDNTELKMTRNCEGFHYVYQKIELAPFTYYQAKVKIRGKIFDYSNGGLLIEDNEGNGLGHHIISKSYNNEDGVNVLLSVKFYSGNTTTVTLLLGFINGMNAEVFFDDASLYEINSDATLACNSCYNRLAQYFKINPFTEINFDNNIKTIIGSLNYLFVDGLKKYYDSGDSKWLSKAEADRAPFTRIMYECLKNTYVIDKLNEHILQTPNSYCQTISLASSEILSMFNISTRHVHFTDETGNGFHQFIEYWNPHVNKWTIIDPFYGVYYANNEELLGVNELYRIIDTRGFDPKLINRIQINEFYYDEEALVVGWTGNYSIQLFKDDRFTYP